VNRALTISDRIRSSKSKVTSGQGWGWLGVPFFVGLTPTLFAGHFLFREDLGRALFCLGCVLRDSLGFKRDSFFDALGWVPHPRAVELSYFYLDAIQWKFWTLLFIQFVTMAGFIFWRERQKTPGKNYSCLNPEERDSVSTKELAVELRKASKKMGREFKPSPFDVNLGLPGIRIPERSLASMLGVVGGAGQGKTNILNKIVSSRRDSKEKCFIVDVNGEYAARFARRRDIILSLHDSRAVKWDLWAEHMPLEDIADAILETGEHGSSGASSEFFSTASHTVLTALLQNSRSEKELWELVNLDRGELIDKIRAMPGLAKQMLGKGNEGQTLGVLATALRKLAPFEHLNAVAHVREEKNKDEEQTFSVNKWVHDNEDKRWVFLVTTDAHLNQNRTLFRIWLSILTKSLMARSESSADERIYLVCDELATVGKIPRLADFLTAVRRKKGRAILGFQTMSQIEAIYGKEDFKTILQGLQNLIIFKCADPHMSELMAERIGKVQAMQNVFSQSMDRERGDYIPQVGEHLGDRWIFSPNVLSNLGIGEAILCISQFSPCRVKLKLNDFKNIQPTAQYFQAKVSPVVRAGADAQPQGTEVIPKTEVVQKEEKPPEQEELPAIEVGVEY
jgi:hypothetical protein